MDVAQAKRCAEDWLSHPAGPPTLPINISPITHFDYQNAKHDVLNIADDPIVPDAAASVSTELRAGQRLARTARKTGECILFKHQKYVRYMFVDKFYTSKLIAVYVLTI